MTHETMPLPVAPMTADEFLKLHDAGKIDDLVELSPDLGPRHAEDCTVQEIVFAASQFRMESGADLEQARHAAVEHDSPRGLLGDSGKDFQQRALPGPVPADDPDHFGARLRAELQDIGSLLTNRKLVQERIVGQPGDRIRIFGGSMAELEGKIISLKPNRFAVVIEVSLIAGRIVVEIDEGLLTRDLL